MHMVEQLFLITHLYMKLTLIALPKIVILIKAFFLRFEYAYLKYSYSMHNFFGFPVFHEFVAIYASTSFDGLGSGLKIGYTVI